MRNMFLLWQNLGFVAVGAVIVLPLILLNIKYASRLGLIDWPKARGIAEDQIPLIGHSMVLFSIAAMLVLNHLYQLSPWFITTAVFVGVMGHLDDRKPLGALDKMGFQVFCALAVVFLDPQLRAAVGDTYGTWGSLCAAFFIVALMNAVNFIDGIDGLASIVLFVGSLGFLLFNPGHKNLYPQMVLASLFVGVLIPFFYFNVKVRRGFLGNVGSYFFSYCLAIMHLSIPMPAAGPISRLSLTGLCFLVPIADSLMVISSRLSSFRSPFQADKGHLHHRLIQTSIPLAWILINFAGIETSALIVAVMVSRVTGASVGVLPIFLAFSHIGITAVLILLVEKASRRRLQAYFQRLDTGAPIYFLKYQFTNQDGSPISRITLRRLEARVSAEIRVTDLCYAEKPNTLFVTLKTMAEPLRGISGRLEGIFQSEKVISSLVVDEGEFVKVSRPKGPPFHRKSA